MIEVLSRESAKLRQLLRNPRAEIHGQEHVAVFSDAGRLWSPSRLAALVDGESRQWVVVRWIARAEARAGKPSALRLA